MRKKSIRVAVRVILNTACKRLWAHSETLAKCLLKTRDTCHPPTDYPILTTRIGRLTPFKSWLKTYHLDIPHLQFLEMHAMTILTKLSLISSTVVLVDRTQAFVNHRCVPTKRWRWSSIRTRMTLWFPQANSSSMSQTLEPKSSHKFWLPKKKSKITAHQRPNMTSRWSGRSNREDSKAKWKTVLLRSPYRSKMILLRE